ncbi:hypothetical protein ACU8M5_10770 [Rhizobium leguminosarum]
MIREEPQNLWEKITSLEALQAAWYRVAENEGSPGADLVTIRGFGANLFANLTQLRAELLGGTYRSGTFRKVSVPKKKPGYRILTIPSIRDRVLHTSIAFSPARLSAAPCPRRQDPGGRRQGARHTEPGRSTGITAFAVACQPLSRCARRGD